MCSSRAKPPAGALPKKSPVCFIGLHPKRTFWAEGGFAQKVADLQVLLPLVLSVVAAQRGLVVWPAPCRIPSIFRLSWRVINLAHSIPGTSMVTRAVAWLTIIVGSIAGYFGLSGGIVSLPKSTVIAAGACVALFISAYRLAAELEKESTVRIELDPTNPMRRTVIKPTDETLAPPAIYIELMIGIRCICKDRALITTLDFSLMKRRRLLWAVPVAELRQTKIVIDDQMTLLHKGVSLDALSIRSFGFRAYGFLPLDYKIDERHFLRVRAMCEGREPSVSNLFWDWSDTKRRSRESKTIFTLSELRKGRDG